MITIKSFTEKYKRAVYNCPHCSQYVVIDLNAVELSNICPLCGQDITVKGGENNEDA